MSYSSEGKKAEQAEQEAFIRRDQHFRAMHRIRHVQFVGVLIGFLAGLLGPGILLVLAGESHVIDLPITGFIWVAITLVASIGCAGAGSKLAEWLFYDRALAQVKRLDANAKR